MRYESITEEYGKLVNDAHRLGDEMKRLGITHLGPICDRNKSEAEIENLKDEVFEHQKSWRVVAAITGAYLLYRLGIYLLIA